MTIQLVDAAHKRANISVACCKGRFRGGAEASPILQVYSIPLQLFARQWQVMFFSA